MSKPAPASLVSRPAPVVSGVRPLTHAPPQRLAPRMRTLYQARIFETILPAHPHLHALTLDDLAREWGVPRTQLAPRLTGRLTISGPDLLFMADELGVTPHELMAGILSYLTPLERATARDKNRAASAAQYQRRKAAAGKPGYTATGRRSPLQTLILERLPPDQRRPLPEPKPEPKP